MSLNEEAIAEKLAELEPAWAGRPNIFTKEIAAKDVKAIAPRLDDSLPAIRGDAAEALGQLKDTSATARLKALLADGDSGVRRSAAIALAALGDEGLANEFVKNLLDGSARVVAGAATAIGLAGYKAAVPYLLKAYRTEHPRVAAAVATALGQLKDRQAVPWLVTAMKTGLAPVEAAAALGELNDPAATRPLCEALNHELPALRAAAARSLGRLAQAGSVDFVLKDQALASLHKLTKDPDERVRFCAALALAGFGDPVGQNHLKQLLASLTFTGDHMAARKNEEPSRPPMPQPEYPAIATFVDKAQKADIDELFQSLKDGLSTMKGPKAEQAKKVSKAIERTEELMSHLLQVREKIASERKGKR